MAPVIVIAGYGTGISAAVATNFAKKGFALALLSRTQPKLDTAAAALSAEHGVQAKGFAVDLSDADAVKKTIAKVHAALGNITVLFWNPYGMAKGVLDGDAKDFISEFSLTTASLITAVQAAYADLKAQPGVSAVLVTGGGLGLDSEQSVETAVGWNAATLAIAKAAQHKAGAILAKQLAADSIYVATLIVAGLVKFTLWDPQGNSELTAEAIANKFMELYTARSPNCAIVS